MKKVSWNGREVDSLALLAELHNHTRAIGMGMLHDIGRGMTRDEAAKLWSNESRFAFDYFLGRPIKVWADPDGSIGENSVRLYDRDAGQGAFARAFEAALKHEVTP